jgi:uncharacterized protein YoxC
VLHRLDDLVKRAEVSLQGSQRVIGQMEHLRGQAEGVRSQFGAWLLDAASELDRLEARREELAGPLSTAAEKVMRVTPVLADDLKIAVTTLDQLQLEQTILREAVQAGVTLARHTSGELNNQSAQLKALIDGSVLTLSRRVEEAGRWLGELIVRAEEAGRRVEPGAALPAVKAAEPVMAISPACVIAEVTGWAAQPALRAPTPAAATEVTPKVSFTPPLPANSYGLPLPPALPIDALSFDGAPVVFGHGDSESAD